MNKLSVIICTGMGMILFQNFDFAIMPFGFAVENIDQASRIEHAAELLGHSYKGSAARNINKANLNLAVYAEFKNRLPKEDKWQAAPLANLVIQESNKYQLDPIFIMAIIAQESSFRTKARGPVGEIGLMQLRPSTAAHIAQKAGITFHGEKTLEQPFLNLKIGIAYMAQLRQSFKGKAKQYISAYNMGSRNVRRLIASAQTPNEYSSKVMKKYEGLYAHIYVRSTVKPLRTSSMIAKNN